MTSQPSQPRGQPLVQLQEDGVQNAVPVWTFWKTETFLVHSPAHSPVWCWRGFLRARVKIDYKCRRNTFACPWKFWRGIGWRRKCGSNWGCYDFLLEQNIVKCSVQCHVFAQSPKEDCKTFCPTSRFRPVTKRRLYNVLSSVTYSPSHQKKTVKRSVQCHVFAQLPKEDCKTFCPMSRIRPVTKRRL